MHAVANTENWNSYLEYLVVVFVCIFSVNRFRASRYNNPKVRFFLWKNEELKLLQVSSGRATVKPSKEYIPSIEQQVCPAGERETPLLVLALDDQWLFHTVPQRQELLPIRNDGRKWEKLLPNITSTRVKHILQILTFWSPGQSGRGSSFQLVYYRNVILALNVRDLRIKNGLMILRWQKSIKKSSLRNVNQDTNNFINHL